MAAARRIPAYALRVIALIASVAGIDALAGAPELKAGAFSPARIAPDFSLTGSDGSALTLRRFRGKVVLLGFGYTSCPSVCPVTLATLAAAQRKLGAHARDVQVVYVTVDPVRDDAARMKGYLEAFHPDFLGATGTEEALEAVRREYGIAAKRLATPAGSYEYGHSSFVYLIDREGRLRALMPYGRAAADYVHDAMLLLSPP
ncbi:MAG TPA: SCO family protein [Candidatus Saccharimonadia bacterium]|nr:SCO family protein [Candidatus Saccharimonadia bacterium]